MQIQNNAKMYYRRETEKLDKKPICDPLSQNRSTSEKVRVHE